MDVVLALLRYFPHGGMQRDMLATAELLRQRGATPRIVCHTFEGPRPDGIAIDVLPAPGAQNHRRAARFARALGDHLHERPAALVLGFDKLPGLDWYFAADPCFVSRTAGRPWPYRLTQRYRTFRRLEAEVFAPDRTTRVLLLDAATGDDYRRVWNTPVERFELLPPGIAPDRCRGDDADQLRKAGRAELGLADDERALLLLAANPQLKGLDRALDALASLPTATRARTRLLAVGGDGYGRWRREAARRGVADRVLFLKPRDDVPTLLQTADLLLHPARRDTTGTVLLEALVAGLPVVCSEACGYAQRIAAAGVGEVVPEPCSPAALAAACDRQLQRPRGEVVAAAARYRADHELHALHERLLELVLARHA